MDVKERLGLAIKCVTDRRLRQDIRSLKCASSLYAVYAWDLCKGLDIGRLLTPGATAEDIVRKARIRDRLFLEHILDFLVQRGVLAYDNGVYTYVKEPAADAGARQFLEKNCPFSVRWNDLLCCKAKDVLLSGKKPKSAGFGDKQGVLLWEGVMEEAPYSFRKMAIQKFIPNLKEGARVIDLGCGGGIGLEQMILLSKKRIALTGLDPSKEYLERARLRLERLEGTTNEKIIKENLEGIRLLRGDISSLKEKFDVIFLSLVINHVEESARPAFFASLKGLLNENGVVVSFQFAHQSKFERVPMWVMNVVPSHYDFPFRAQYVGMLKSVFGSVEEYLNGTIIVARPQPQRF